VWGPDYGNQVDYLRAFIKSLRKKIEPNPETRDSSSPSLGSGIVQRHDRVYLAPLVRRAPIFMIFHAFSMTSSGAGEYSQVVTAHTTCHSRFKKRLTGDWASAYRMSTRAAIRSVSRAHLHLPRPLRRQAFCSKPPIPGCRRWAETRVASRRWPQTSQLGHDVHYTGRSKPCPNLQDLFYIAIGCVFLPGVLGVHTVATSYRNHMDYVVAELLRCCCSVT